MSFFRIVLKSLRQHWLSTALAVISIGLGCALLIAVVSLRQQTYDNFRRTGLGIDAVLGPKGSPLQIVLNAVYNLEVMPGKIGWDYYKTIGEHQIVTESIPFCTGHSYMGYRVNSIDPRFFTDFEYQPGKSFSFDEQDGGAGRLFAGAHEAIAGWEVATKLGLKLGDTFNPVCGVNAGDPVHVHDLIAFVGFLAPTGTPYDRTIYIPLLTFYGLEGHGEKTARMAEDETSREISGAYIKIKRIRGGAIHPGIQDLKYIINQGQEAQLVVPNEELPRLFSIIGWVDKVLVAIAAMVSCLGALFLFVALLSALRERRRDIALMRTLGATRRTIFGLVLSESLVICLLGGVLGIVLGHVIVGVGAHFIKVETGVDLTAAYVSAADVLLLPCVAVLGVLTGLVPAVQAYRLGVLKNLAPIS